MNAIKVLYIGEDQIFFGLLTKEVEEKSGAAKKFEVELHQFSSKQISPIVNKIREIGPDYILFDLGYLFKEYLKIIHFLSLTFPVNQIKIIGLLNTVPDTDQLFELMVSRILFYHVKSLAKSEFLNTLSLAIGQKEWPEIATAFVSKEETLQHYSRLGYVTEDYLHTEGNLDLSVGAKVQLGKSSLPGISEQNYLVKSRADENLYYAFQNAYDLEWDTNLYLPKNFMEEREKAMMEEDAKLAEEQQANAALHDAVLGVVQEGQSESGKDQETKEDLTYVAPPKKARSDSDRKIQIAKEIALLKERLAEKIESSKNLIKKFILSHKQESIGKKTRILVIDDNYAILEKAKKALDQFPYSIRVSGTLDPEGKVIKKTKPGIVCLVLDPQRNTLQVLDMLIKQIGQMEGYKPIVVVFNGKKEYQDTIKSMNYGKIMMDPSGFNFDILMEYSKQYELKGGRLLTHEKEIKGTQMETRAFLDKSRPESVMAIKIPVVIKNINEVLVVLESKTPLPLYEKFALTWPFPLTLVIVGSLNGNQFSAPTKGKDHYLAMICGLTEREKQEMRVLIYPFVPRPQMEEEEEEEEEI